MAALGLSLRAPRIEPYQKVQRMLGIPPEDVLEDVGERWDVETVLGTGATGDVVKAVNKATGATVALKRIPLDRLADVAVPAIRREVEALRVLHASPEDGTLDPVVEEGRRFVAQYYGSVVTPRCFVIVMEYVEGVDLRDALGPEGARWVPTDEQAVPITRALASALAFVHAHAIAHRDVKPENILLRPVAHPSGARAYQPVLVDFGVACVVKEEGGPGVGGCLSQGGVGTYAPPEGEEVPLAAARGDAVTALKLLQAGDVWALGRVVYEMCNPGRTLGEGPPRPEGTGLPLMEAQTAMLQDNWEKRPTARDVFTLLAPHPAPRPFPKHAEEALRALVDVGMRHSCIQSAWQDEDGVWVIRLNAHAPAPVYLPLRLSATQAAVFVPTYSAPKEYTLWRLVET